jgi:hypothetical protein
MCFITDFLILHIKSENGLKAFQFVFLQTGKLLFFIRIRFHGFRHEFPASSDCQIKLIVDILHISEALGNKNLTHVLRLIFACLDPIKQLSLSIFGNNFNWGTIFWGWIGIFYQTYFLLRTQSKTYPSNSLLNGTITSILLLTLLDRFTNISSSYSRLVKISRIRSFAREFAPTSTTVVHFQGSSM